MADDKTTGDDVQDEAVETPESMDDIIEAEAEANVDEERGNDGQEQADAESDEREDSDDDSDAKAESQESDETDKDETEDEQEELIEDETEDEEQGESEPIDTSKFSDVGLDAVPDDYKPQSWKSFLEDTVNIIRGEVNKEARALDEQQEAFRQEVDAVDQGWQSEIEELQKSGDIPKGDDAEDATKAVFEYMAENNQKFANEPNKQIWSFATAHKLMQAEKVTDERKEEIKQKRRSRASTTASRGSEGRSSSSAPTKGMSLDDIIENELFE